MNGFSWKVTRILPMLLMMGIIFFLSSVPGEDLVLPDIVNIDKVAHMAIYGLLALSVFHAFGGAGSIKRIRIWCRFWSYCFVVCTG